MTDIQSRSTGPETSRTEAVASTAKDESVAVARDAKHAAGEVASTAREQVGNVVQEAGQQARQVAGSLGDRLRGEADQQAKKVAEGLRGLADQLASMADNGDQDSMAAGAVRQLADKGRQAAGFLDEQGLRGAVDSVQDFARRKPGMFLLGAVAAGFLTGRVVKSTTGDSVREQSEAPTQSMPAMGTGYAAPGAGYASGTGYAPGAGYASDTGYASGAGYASGSGYAQPAAPMPHAGQTPPPMPPAPPVSGGPPAYPAAPMPRTEEADRSRNGGAPHVQY